MPRKGLWWLIDTGNFAQPTITLHHECFHLNIHDNTILNPWCFCFIDIPSSNAPLLHDIQEGTVWLISDGSYNPTLHHGMAAWLLEGIASTLQISGRVITPGSASNQSAYCSEWAGIFAAITVINTFASCHNLTAAITLHCNCERGIGKAFSYLWSTQLQDLSPDLLKAIHYELSHSQISWLGVHVKGHHDDTVPFDQLGCPSQLKVLVNQMAKCEHICSKSQIPKPTMHLPLERTRPPSEGDPVHIPLFRIVLKWEVFSHRTLCYVRTEPDATQDPN
jgi:hypothetical protein